MSTRTMTSIRAPHIEDEHGRERSSPPAPQHHHTDADERLRGRRVLFVMGAYAGKRPLYERARELGVTMVMLNGPGHWAQSAPDLFEQFIEVDMADPATLLPRSLAAIAATGLQFDAVATFNDFAGPLTAQIAAHLGLPGHPPTAVAASRHKATTRAICLAAGIPTPRFARICSPADLEPAAAAVGFPAVLKPVSGACSAAVYRIESMDALRRRYAQNCAAARETDGATGVTGSDLAALVWGGSYEMLLEAYVDGEEFDVDCLLSAGDLVYARLVRDLPMPHMVETGQQLPPRYPADRQQALIELARRSLAALGFRDGAFHVEVKDSAHGPRLIEVNARIGGGPAWRMHRQVWGVDLVEQYLMIQLGIPIRPVPSAAPQTYLLTSDLPAPYSGVVTRDDFLDHLIGRPHVLAAYPKVRPGQRVVGPDSGVPQWLGEIIVEGASVAQAEAIMAAILADLDIPIAPERPRRGRQPGLAQPPASLAA